MFNGNYKGQLPCTFVVEDSVSVHLTDFQFYVHDILLLSNGEVIGTADGNHFLLDAKDSSGMYIEIPVRKMTSVDEVSFAIGVDSVMQSSGAQSGSLDPIRGMYWTWQSGYIHWKLEATITAGIAENSIVWHIGGYRFPYNTIRQVRLPVPNVTSTELVIECDLSKLVSEGNREFDSSIMSPSKYALNRADIFQTCFKFNDR